VRIQAHLHTRQWTGVNQPEDELVAEAIHEHLEKIELNMRRTIERCIEEERLTTKKGIQQIMNPAT
jgi:hypothetical protein